MASQRQSCLIVLSAAIEGVSTQSFIQAFTAAQASFNVQLASPDAKAVEFVHTDDTSRRWLSDFRTKSYATPISLSAIDASRYTAVLIPHSPGAVHDLSQNAHLAAILQHFIREKKPICAVGLGVAALCCARHRDSNKWSFANFSMTASSVYELAKSQSLQLKIIPEDFIKDNCGKYTSSESGAVHIVLDRHLVTGQNEASTLTAVQNLILLTNQRQGATSGSHVPK